MASDVGCGPARRLVIPITILLSVLLTATASAQSRTGEEEPTSPLLETPTPSSSTSPVLRAVREEAQRYWSDTKYVVLSPLHWESSEWIKAGAFVAALAVLGKNDAAIDSAVQKNRSSSTESASSAVTPFGSYVAVGASVAALGGGWILRDTSLRDTGRDAIEAEVIAAGIVTPILKTLTGRLRPSQGSDSDEFHGLSGNQSFPSGHATEAFAVASVFAARSQGWIVPTLSYTLASMVGLARIHDHAHFASDVFAGAVIGTTIGRSIVHRHFASPEQASWEVVPFQLPRGAGLVLRIGTPAPPPPPEALAP
jgi:membrane-associated phospholipid phosphatase